MKVEQVVKSIDTKYSIINKKYKLIPRYIQNNTEEQQT